MENYLRNFYSNYQESSSEMPNFTLDVDVLEEAEIETPAEEQRSEENQSSQEIDDFINQEKAKNTVKKTKLDWEKFYNFCKSNKADFNIEEVPAAELDKLLCKFFKDVRKQNGGEYEPDSLSSFQKSIQRHIKDLKLSFNILKDEAFSRSREVLVAKRKNLVKQGRGNKPNATRYLSIEEEAKLFECGEFGSHSPQALQRTLWWFFSLHFGFRARDESRKLCRGDVVLETDPQTGREMLVWTAERGSKTRRGLEGSHRRKFNPKIFATGTENCPVHLYKFFRSHRPETACQAESPFFLAVNHHSWRAKKLVWYKCSALGKNEIGKFLSSAAQHAGIPSNGKKVSNHSVRKTSISRLLDAEVPETFVAQLSGHKNIQSLSSYKSASMEQQRKMSDALADPTPTVTAPAAAAKHISASVKRTSFAVAQTEEAGGRNFFAGANIGSISNCVFKVFYGQPSDPSAHASPPKRQKIADDEQ